MLFKAYSERIKAENENEKVDKVTEEHERVNIMSDSIRWMKNIMKELYDGLHN